MLQAKNAICCGIISKINQGKDKNHNPMTTLTIHNYEGT
jgi:hypothetical protein